MLPKLLVRFDYGSPVEDDYANCSARQGVRRSGLTTGRTLVLLGFFSPHPSNIDTERTALRTVCKSVLGKAECVYCLTSWCVPTLAAAGSQSCGCEPRCLRAPCTGITCAGNVELRWMFFARDIHVCQAGAHICVRRRDVVCCVWLARRQFAS